MKFFKAFAYAWKGLSLAWREERNFQIEILCAVLVLVLGFWFSVSFIDFALLVFAIGLVFVAELLNTALEELCDMLQSSHDPHVEKIKDLGAGAVLVASLTVLIIGLLVFVPYFL